MSLPRPRVATSECRISLNPSRQNHHKFPPLREIVGQRVQVGSLDPFDGGLSIPVQSHRILSASEVNDEDVELFLAICIIQLSAKVEVPALNLPYGESRPDFKEGGLIAFGFGSTVPNKHDVPSQMQAAEFIPTDDPEKRKCVFNRLYLRLRLTDVADDFDFFCMKERTEKLSLYDSGGPLVDKSSRIIYGTALAVFPNSTTYEQTLSHPAVFLPVSPHRFMIEWALEEMDKQVI